MTPWTSYLARDGVWLCKESMFRELCSRQTEYLSVSIQERANFLSLSLCVISREQTVLHVYTVLGLIHTACKYESKANLTSTKNLQQDLAQVNATDKNDTQSKTWLKCVQWPFVKRNMPVLFVYLPGFIWSAETDGLRRNRIRQEL